MGMIFDLCFGSLIGNKKHITRTSKKKKIKNLSIKYDPSLFKTEEFTQQLNIINEDSDKTEILYD